MIFSFACLLSGGQLLKNCSLRSKPFPLRVGPFSNGFVPQKQRVMIELAKLAVIPDIANGSIQFFL